MKISAEERRKKAIRLRFKFSETECKCCGNYYKHEKMWQFYRYGSNKTVFRWNYCQHCMPSADDVLHEIDTDENPFGLAGIDPYMWFEKKDATRMNALQNRMFKSMGIKE